MQLSLFLLDRKGLQDTFGGEITQPDYLSYKVIIFSSSQFKERVTLLMNWPLESKCSERLTILFRPTVSSQEAVGGMPFQSGQYQWEIIMASTGC